MAIPLVEVFYSVQGEGTNAGQAAVFVRFAGCNLDCVFADGSICDTPWRKPRMKWELDELDHHIQDLAPPVERDKRKRPWVILTGGEPTAAPSFDSVVARLTENYRVAVETNGTRWREGLRLCRHVCVSPKHLLGITHAKPLDNPQPLPEVLRVASEFRFVITNRDQPCPVVPVYAHPEADWFVSPAVEADGSGNEIIKFQDEGVMPQFVPGAVERCVEIVQENPRWKISIQTHKFMMVR